MTIERYRIAAYFVVSALVAGTQAFGQGCERKGRLRSGVHDVAFRPLGRSPGQPSDTSASIQCTEWW
jgi:hypothetical protein